MINLFSMARIMAMYDGYRPILLRQKDCYGGTPPDEYGAYLLNKRKKRKRRRK